jgi:hypothetical protein
VDLLHLPRPFTVNDARQAGMTRDLLTGLMAAGIIRRVLREAYVDAKAPDSLQLRAAAVSRVVPAGALVCRGTAAWLYGVDVTPMTRDRTIPTVEIIVPEGMTVPKRAGCVAFTGKIESRDIEIVNGVAVTSPCRTALDLARYRPRPDALAAVDALTHAELVALEELVDELPRFRGGRNIARAAEVISLAEPKTESPGESRLRLRIVDAGFPRPEPQIEFFEDGVLIYRLDLGIRALQRGMEYDGERHEQQTEYDEFRRQWLRRRGWEYLSFHRGHVLRNDFVVERAVGEMLGIEPRRRLPVPGWG